MNNRWFNSSQPQTVQTAVILLYINAFFALFGGLLGGGVVGIIPLLGAAGAYGFSNDRKWGYYLSCVVAILPLVIFGAYFLDNGNIGTGSLVSVLFTVALVVLLFHPMTRAYVRLWLK